jgi:small subunit ribosomal protein S20
LWTETDVVTKGATPLANHKSALKRARQSEIRRLRNKSTKTRVKNVVKDVRQAVAGQSGADAVAELNAAKSAIDKAAKKGIIHPNTAARKVSRLTKQVNAVRK